MNAKQQSDITPKHGQQKQVGAHAALVDRLEAIVVAYRRNHRLDYSPWRSQWLCADPTCTFTSAQRERGLAQLEWEDHHGAANG